jgi:hypothetical protein
LSFLFIPWNIAFQGNYREITLLLYFLAKLSREFTLSLYFPANDRKQSKRLSFSTELQ